MTPQALLKSVRIQGYRPFGDFEARLGPLEVLAGANGSGKSSLFEFLKFLRDGVRGEIPPEIVPGAIGQRIFHTPGPERFSWSVEVDFAGRPQVRYEGELMGPVGRWQLTLETARTVHPAEEVMEAHEVAGGSGILRTDRNARRWEDAGGSLCRLWPLPLSQLCTT